MKLSVMFSHWEQVRRGLLETIDKFSEKELTYVPYNGSWIIGQTMLHIADCEDNWLHGVVRAEFKPWIFYDFQYYPNKELIVEQLNKARARTIKFLESVDERNLDDRYAIPDGTEFTLRWIIWHVLEHEIHHRGELSLALGMMGREGLDV